MVIPSFSGASLCAVLAPCPRAAFSSALHARGIALLGGSWAANRVGVAKNVLELFVISRGCEKGEKKVRGKNIAVNTIKMRNWKWLLLLPVCMEALLEMLRKCGFLKSYLLGAIAYLYREMLSR